MLKQYYLSVDLLRVNRGGKVTAQIEPSLDDVVSRAIELFNASSGVKLIDWDDIEEFHEVPRAYEAADAVRDALKEFDVTLPAEPLSGWPQGGIHIDDSWPEAEERVIAQIPDYEERLQLHQQAAWEHERKHGR
jgi:transcriptional/translational regulatory protein YebC/TACO1